MKNLRDVLAPALLGVAILVLWEMACRFIPISPILLPAPSVIWQRLINEVSTLRLDFFMTVIQAVIPGWLIGCCDIGDNPRRSQLLTALSKLPKQSSAHAMLALVCSHHQRQQHNLPVCSCRY